MVLILYTSKHGTTTTCVHHLKELIADTCIICNIDKDPIPDVNKFDKILIGSSIYFGRPSKSILTFCNQHAEELFNKEIGLFLVGSRTLESDEIFESNFKAVFTHAEATAFFGGLLDLNKMNFFERFIVKTVSKKDPIKTPTILYQNIESFASYFNT